MHKGDASKLSEVNCSLRNEICLLFAQSGKIYSNYRNRLVRFDDQPLRQNGPKILDILSVQRDLQAVGC